MPTLHSSPLASPLASGLGTPASLSLKLRQSLDLLARAGNRWLMDIHTLWMSHCDARDQRALLQGLPEEALRDLGLSTADVERAQHCHKIIL